MNAGGELGLDFRLLGPFEVASSGRLIEIGSSKQRALLAILLVHRSRAVSFDALAEELWTGHPPASVVTTLSSLVSRLRRLLAAAGSEESGVFLRSGGSGYLLEVDARRVDAHRFEELVAQARKTLAGGTPEVASRLLGQALALWRGPALADLADRSFARAEAHRLDEARLEVIEELSEVELISGRPSAALALLEPQVAAQPLRERAWGLLMLSLYRVGRQAEALRAYQDLRRLLGEELGLEPTPSLRRLEQQILLQSPELDSSAGRYAGPLGQRGGVMPGSSTVTILFTDLVGSTELAARLGDDAADDVRRAHFGALRSALVKTGGEEVKTLGDGLMAAFPSTVDAIEAAVRMQQAVDRLNRRSGRAPLEVRVGLSVGEATREEGDYFGTPAVAAARLCAAARGGQILVSEVARLFAIGRGNHHFAPLGALELKGLPEPLATWELLWERTSVQRIPFPPPLATEGSSPFVGRGAELERLLGCWKRVLTGERQLVLIAGEPGIGKTRLATEVALAAHEGGATVLFGRCDEEALVPYQPFVEALRHYATAVPPDELRAQAGPWGAELGRLVPELAQPLVGPPGAVWDDPESQRYRLFEAVAGLLEAASEDVAVLLVLDDVQWADKPTLLLLKHLTRALRSSALMVLGTYRESELARTHPLAKVLADLRRENLVQRIPLRGLAEAEVAALVGAWGAAQRADLAGAVFAETEGNPFFVEEVLRHLSETGRLGRDAPLEVAGIPEGVKEVIGRRLSRLSEEANRALGLASVIGREFGLGVLRLVSGVSDEALLGAIEEAVAAALVAEVPGVLDSFTFSHALVRQTLYEELATSRRVRVHRQVAHALEELSAQGPEPPLAQLAYHYSEAAEGGEADKAVEYAVRAAEHARTMLAYEETAGHYERALHALELNDTPDEGRRCGVLLEMAGAHSAAGDTTRARELFLRAGDSARRLGDGERLARAALGYTTVLAFLGAAPDPLAVGFLDEALEKLGAEEGRLRVGLLSALGLELYFSGQLERRQSLAAEALDMARRLGDQEALGFALFGRVAAMHGSPETEARVPLVDEIVRLAEETRNSKLVVYGHAFRVMELVALGDMAAVDAEIETVTRLGQEVRQPFVLTYPLMWKAMRALFEGRFEEAERLAQEALALGQEAQGYLGPDTFAAQMFALRREQGRLAELEEEVRATVEADASPYYLRSSLAVLYAELDRRSECAAEFARLAAEGFGGELKDYRRQVVPALLAEACAYLGDGDSAAELYELLIPYSDQCPYFGWVVVCFGSVSRPLGMLAATMGRWREAEVHFEAALAQNARMGGLPWVAHTQYDEARMLLARGEPGDRERARGLLQAALATAAELGMGGLTHQVQVLAAECDV